MAPAGRIKADAPRVITFRRAWVTLLFVVAILGGALLGVFLAYENDLPQISTLEDYTSHNTERLSVAALKQLLLKVDFIQRSLQGEDAGIAEI